MADQPVEWVSNPRLFYSDFVIRYFSLPVSPATRGRGTLVSKSANSRWPLTVVGWGFTPRAFLPRRR